MLVLCGMHCLEYNYMSFTLIVHAYHRDIGSPRCSSYISIDISVDFSVPVLEHKHNTYHGPSSKHFRAPLPQSSDAKPLRFTDSPQHRLSRSRRKSRPLPRRKSSSVTRCTDDKSHVSVYC